MTMKSNSKTSQRPQVIQIYAEIMMTNTNFLQHWLLTVKFLAPEVGIKINIHIHSGRSKSWIS